MSAQFVDLEGIKASIAEVRHDKTATNWVLLTYDAANSNNVILAGKGEGGVNELIELLADDNVGYGLVRIVEKFDESDTVKFIFIRWVGDNIHRMLRARLGTHSGAIKEIISPYHVNVEASNKSEISEDIVIHTVRKTSGTSSNVVDRPASSSSQSSPSFTPKKSGGVPRASVNPGGVPQQASNITLIGEEEIKAAIKDVRNDATDTNWVLVTYDAPNSNNIVLAGKGSGGSGELLGYLKDDIVAYGLVRQTEKFDESDRVMFAFVYWTGENIHRMLRAKLGTHSGAIKELFSPYHSDINAERESEISVDIITTSIRDTMGTATRVRN